MSDTTETLSISASAALCREIGVDAFVDRYQTPVATMDPEWVQVQRLLSAVRTKLEMYEGTDYEDWAGERIEILELAGLQIGRSWGQAMPEGFKGDVPFEDLDAIFPEITPFSTFLLPRTYGHSVYVELYGNPLSRKVAMFQHGGPGNGISAHSIQELDPRENLIIVWCQRGIAPSTWKEGGRLRGNTTWDLVRDMEAIRRHVQRELGRRGTKLMLAGQSWGATLSLAYAQRYPQNTAGVVGAGLWLSRWSDVTHLYSPHGAAQYAWPQWCAFRDHIPAEERGGEDFDCEAFLEAYFRRLTSPDAAVREDAAAHWLRYELSLVNLNSSGTLRDLDEFRTAKAASVALMECWYFLPRNHSWLEEDQLLEGMEILREHNIPVWIIQGMQDTICTPQDAQELQMRYPWVTVDFMTLCGHDGPPNKMMRMRRIRELSASL